MKLLILVVVCFALAQAKLDRLKFKPRDIEPEFMSRLRKPAGGRIVGGNEAAPNSFPHQVGLFLTHSNGDGYFCGGSIISETHVLTAAHCAEGIVEVTVILGAHRIRDETEPTQQRIVSTNLVVHPGWDSSTLTNDIAIIVLPESADVASDAISPIAQLSSSEAGNSFEGSRSDVSGWGKDSDDATTISEVLRTINVQVWNNEECNLYYFGMITDNHVCTDQGTCSGDSGGPLIADVNGETKQIGLVSFGISFGCEVGWPAVFTRVGNYLGWIEGETGLKF